VLLKRVRCAFHAAVSTFALSRRLGSSHEERESVEHLTPYSKGALSVHSAVYQDSVGLRPFTPLSIVTPWPLSQSNIIQICAFEHEGMAEAAQLQVSCGLYLWSGVCRAALGRPYETA
jgi:hypothetical protein